jgi:hypothetical protein
VKGERILVYMLGYNRSGSLCLVAEWIPYILNTLPSLILLSYAVQPWPSHHSHDMLGSDVTDVKTGLPRSAVVFIRDACTAA